MNDFDVRVREWFDAGADYSRGVMLLSEKGNASIRKFYKYIGVVNVPEYFKEKLLVLLTPHAAAPGTKAATPPPATREAVITVDHTPAVSLHVVDPNTPPEIAALRDRNAILLRLQTRQKTLLQEATTDEDRAAISRQIMEEIIPELDRNYAMLREYDKSGKIPVLSPSKVGSGEPSEGEMIRKLQSARSSRSRWVKEMKEGNFASVSDRDALQQKIDEKSTLITALEEKLGIANG